MKTDNYTIVKTEEQYFEYCNKIEELLDSGKSDEDDEVELLTLLIEKWDEEHSTLVKHDPIQLLKFLMIENKIKPVDLAALLGVSKGLVSDILHYKKGLSKDIIRKLAERFKLRQEAFNRPYKLKSPYNSHLKNASVMNTKKEMAE